MKYCRLSGSGVEGDAELVFKGVALVYYARDLRARDPSQLPHLVTCTQSPLKPYVRNVVMKPDQFVLSYFYGFFIYILTSYVHITICFVCRQSNRYKKSIQGSVEALKEWHLSPHAPTMGYDAANIDAESLIKGTMVCPWFPQGAGAQGLSVGNRYDEQQCMREAELRQQEARATEELQFIRAELYDMQM
jgi:hypothetical protein